MKGLGWSRLQPICFSAVWRCPSAAILGRGRLRPARLRAPGTLYRACAYVADLIFKLLSKYKLIFSGAEQVEMQ